MHRWYATGTKTQNPLSKRQEELCDVSLQMIAPRYLQKGAPAVKVKGHRYVTDKFVGLTAFNGERRARPSASTEIN